MRPIHIIGGGLAGSEATFQAAEAGADVVLHEMRPIRPTFAHQTEGLAELVCSNSFRSDDWLNNAVGLLHEEMRRADSLIMRSADAHKLPAGGALAVDRHGFSEAVTAALEAHPRVTIRRGEITELPPPEDGLCIVATGPLTSEALGQSILQATGENALAFFDAIAPIVHRDSINFDIAWMQSRYDKEGPGGGTADYINLPMDEAQYRDFVAALLAGDKGDWKEWEKTTPYFEACLPVEVMAERGVETLSFGPMKPVGLRDPHRDTQPYAVVQLRQDNALGTLWNMVGFQTKLKHGEQVRIFRTIPGLENAEFARLGGMHRNTFINSPRLLEGYVESAAIGLLAGRLAAAEQLGRVQEPPPATTAFGALLSHITGGADAKTFQPMNVNFGLFPDLEAGTNPRTGKPMKIKGGDRKQAMAKRALEALDTWLEIKPVTA